MRQTDEDVVRRLLRDFRADPIPVPDMSTVVQRGERRARWRTVDRYLAVAAVAVVVLAAVLVTWRTGSSQSVVSPSSTGYRIQFRPVLDETVAPPGSCRDPIQHQASASNIRACSADGSTLYTLGAAAVAGDGVAELTAEPASSGGFEVVLHLTAAGANSFRSMTAELVTHPAPRNQFAVYLRGVVQLSPYVEQPITTAVVTVPGFSTQAEAEAFVAGAAP